MFRQLSQRIILIFLLSVWISTCILSIIAYRWAERTLTTQFTDISLNYFRSSDDRLTHFLKYTEENFKLIANHPEITKAMVDPVFSLEASRLMNSLVFDLNLDITDVTVYSTSGFTYSVSKLLKVPPMEKLREIPQIQAFLDQSVEKYIWTPRYHGVNGENDQTYASTDVLSYLLKMEASGQLLGTIVVDVDTQQLFQFFQTKNVLFHDNNMLLIRNGTNLSHPLYESSKSQLAPADLQKINNTDKGHFVSTSNNQLILFSTIANSDTKMVMLNPLKEPTKQLTMLKWSLIAFSILFCIFSVYTAVQLRNSIIQPLKRLYNKINDLMK